MRRTAELRRRTWLLLTLLAIAGGVVGGGRVVEGLDSAVSAPSSRPHEAPRPAADAESRLPTQLAAQLERLPRVAARLGIKSPTPEVGPEQGGTPPRHRPSTPTFGIFRPEVSVTPTSIPHTAWLARTGAVSSYATSLPPPHVA